MKTSRFLIAAAFAMAIIALIWQARTIAILHAESKALRDDLRTVLSTALDASAPPNSEPEQARRDKLELIKLRLEVRELREGMATAHAESKSSSLRGLLSPLAPSGPVLGNFKLRPEWKGMEAKATNGYAKAIQALKGATNEHLRYLHLDEAAKMSFAVGRTEDARQFASDLLTLMDKFSRGSPRRADGAAVHDGNLILGRIAVEENRLEQAKRHLLAAGTSQGSPVLGSFGPNMGLAKDLLEKGEPETVLQYFELCRKFWSDPDKLDRWTKDVEAGRIPEFGANLIF